MPQLCTGLVVLGLTGTAGAGPALDGGDSSGTTTEPKVDPNTGGIATDAEPPVEYGVGLRVRNVRIPKGLLGVFLDRTGGGSSNVGIGGELIRRKGNVELQLGFEYEKISVGEGVWIESGKNVPANEADYVLGPDHGSNLGWFTIEFTFMNHAVINKYVSFRYGGGAGLGFITGSLLHFNVQCAPGSTNTNVDPGCVPPEDKYTGPSGQRGTATYTEGGATPSPYDLHTPVFPVVNAIIGVQIKPTPQFAINLEGGIRLMPFFGMSTAYFF